jgi:hypothetical protein
LLFAEAVQRGVEQVFEERRRAVFIGIGQSGFIGCVGDAKMHQFAFTASQPVADLPQRISMGQLAERHGHELRPAGESFGGAFGQVFLDQRGELQSGKMLQKLIEQAGSLYHKQCPP